MKNGGKNKYVAFYNFVQYIIVSKNIDTVKYSVSVFLYVIKCVKRFFSVIYLFFMFSLLLVFIQFREMYKVRFLKDLQ